MPRVALCFSTLKEQLFRVKNRRLIEMFTTMQTLSRFIIFVKNYYLENT